jgi:redox-sensitive bicupin YhaK (pirin superfamily)
MTPQLNTAMKSVKKILPRPHPHWVGNGFRVFPVFSHLAFSGELSPWLMFDYAAPKAFGPTSERLGVGQHPHRGFETVTIAFQGGVEHSDSVGNNDVIGPGDVQWMTAGRGIIHEEYHSTAFARTGGTFEMCQLWVNLPKEHKMHAPRYQPILDREIPVVPLRTSTSPPPASPTPPSDAADERSSCPDDVAGSVRVIAGSFEGTVGPAQTFSPIELWDVSLTTPSRPVLLSLPEGHTAILFVRKGALSVGVEGNEQQIGPQAAALMDKDGRTMRIQAQEANTQVLLLGGAPIDEPIAARGPFVMNTHAELDQANRDYMAGKMGR